MGGEDELSCDKVCIDGSNYQFACKSGQCIDRKRYCDDVKDCDDGSDELHECKCHKNGQFACRGDNQCVSR